MAAIRNGLIPSIREVVDERMQQPIIEGIRAYERHLVSKGDCPEYVRQTIRFLQRFARMCDVLRMSDLVGYRGPYRTPADEALSQFLQSTRTRRGQPYATATRNAALRRVNSFCRWAVQTDRLSESSILKIQPKRNSEERRRKRRALTQEEVERLISMTRHRGGPGRIGRMSRAMLYDVAVHTGFRRNELASLRSEDFALDGNIPYISLRAAGAKNRKATKQPIEKRLASELRQFLRTRPRKRPVWDIPRDAARMLRRDLATAGIPPVDAEGRVIDFHALRHTYITALARNGVSTAHAQILARHASVQTTLGYYTHLELADLGNELDRVFQAAIKE